MTLFTCFPDEELQVIVSCLKLRVIVVSGDLRFGGSSDSGVRPGDWDCSAGGCGAHRFASRSNCFKCGAYKDESANAGAGVHQAKSGDWISGRSGRDEHNFPSRMECYRCSAPRESGTAM
ncbi:hypothetical protein R1sor_015961 [Riccia sorocarpa]|uniref:RanBP2-type domain-containing protein n=1 Tax=Riccia sorocarpa TaxID=122646 RepID=A0ABD3HGU0_9MARC